MASFRESLIVPDTKVRHESHPGHHVLKSLLDQELLRRHGWIEYSARANHDGQRTADETGATP